MTNAPNDGVVYRITVTTEASFIDGDINLRLVGKSLANNSFCCR